MFPEMCALGARLRFGIRSRGRVFFGLAGWFCRAWLDFFLQFQEILDQELDQLLSPGFGIGLESISGLKSWSNS